MDWAVQVPRTGLTLRNPPESNANAGSKKKSERTQIRPWVPFPTPQKHASQENIIVIG